MELKCYLYDGWKPRIRPASTRRDWMDTAPEAFPYRCLPLAIGNSHGWEILSPCGFEAVWNGGPAAEDVTIVMDEGTDSHDAPVALFGLGTITFHVAGLFRTSPGWNLSVSGLPNAAKDGISPLSGIIETDWSPYTFTMNWRFTRADHRVRFEENEPFCFIAPVQRNIIEAIEPQYLSIDDDAVLKAQFENWSQLRDDFHKQVAISCPADPKDKWQKLYYRGIDPHGETAIRDHQTKLHLQPFDGALKPDIPEPKCPVSHHDLNPPQTRQTDDIGALKRDWILQTQERCRSLSAQASAIFRKENISSDEFLDEHYAPGRPVILGNAIGHWPSLTRWTPEYLAARLGDRQVEVQAGRNSGGNYERQKDAFRQSMPFSRFINEIRQPGAANDLYMTAYNSASNAAAIEPLHADLGNIDAALDGEASGARGMLWIGGEGTFTPLHHDLTNNLLVQIRGRKRIVMVPPSQYGKLYNDDHVFSRLVDITDVDESNYPLAHDVQTYEIVLAQGDALFIPIGWWHQVTALDFSVSATHTNFKWPNDAHQTYPGL